MHAVVFHGPGSKSGEEVPDPHIVEDRDAIVRVDIVTICGTDLHILKGHVPTVTDGRVLGHEAVGTVEEVTITTGLVDTYSTPILLRLLSSSRLEAARFVTHHFAFDQFMEAYEVFSQSARTGALKVALTPDGAG